MPVETAARTATEVEVIRKAKRQLLPFLMLAYFNAFVDRVNSGFAALGPFFASSSEWLAGTAVAAGLVQINVRGNLGGFVDSFLIDAIHEATHSYALSLLPLVLLAAVGWVVVLAAWRRTACRFGCDCCRRFIDILKTTELGW